MALILFCRTVTTTKSLGCKIWVISKCDDTCPTNIGMFYYWLATTLILMQMYEPLKTQQVHVLGAPTHILIGWRIDCIVICKRGLAVPCDRFKQLRILFMLTFK